MLLNSPYGPEEVWEHLPRHPGEDRRKELKLYVIDGNRVARDGHGDAPIRSCRPAFLPSPASCQEEAIEKIKKSIQKTYGKKGEEVVRKNFEAVEHTLAHLHEAVVPEQVTTDLGMREVVPPEAPEFVQNVTAMMMAGRGDELPVSALPADGTFPSGTAKWEKRGISDRADLGPDICIQCGNCAFVCPHSVIRSKVYHKDHLGRPRRLQVGANRHPRLPRHQIRYRSRSTTVPAARCVSRHALQRARRRPARRPSTWASRRRSRRRRTENLRFFETLPVNDRSRVDFSTARVQFLEPLFEFPGACAGCGETPYIKLLSQLFGDRLLTANATGCSSIYGGNLPTTPWTVNSEGRGPAWSNSSRTTPSSASACAWPLTSSSPRRAGSS